MNQRQKVEKLLFHLARASLKSARKYTDEGVFNVMDRSFREEEFFNRIHAAMLYRQMVRDLRNGNVQYTEKAMATMISGVSLP